MRQLYASGHLAVVTGVGLPLEEVASLAHDVAQADWQTGQINSSSSQGAYGWVGLTLDGVSGGTLGTMAALSGDVPLILRGQHAQGLALSPPLESFGVIQGGGDDSTQQLQAFQQILALPPANSAVAKELGVVQTAASAIGTVAAIAQANPVADYPDPGGSYLGSQLREIARLILGGSGLRAYWAITGGFDTHSQQAVSHGGLLTDLSVSLQSFYNYLVAKGASSNVVIATVSDFGRRPQANQDFGTDHGAGSVGFVLGDPVTGGVYGTYPDLVNLDVNGNLVIGVDFRNMISDLVGAMGGNPTTVLGQTWPRLGFI